MRPRLRPARPADAPACAAILREWAGETPWFPRPDPPQAAPGFVEERMARGVVIVAEAGGVAGFVAVERGYVNCLYVARGWRGRGVGKRLLDAAKAREHRLVLWTFAANDGARAFYLREGFAERRRSDGANAERLPDVEYVWPAEEA